LNGRSLGDSHEAFKLWNKWWKEQISQLTEESAPESIQKVFNAKKLLEEIEASGYNQLWEGLPFFLTAIRGSVPHFVSEEIHNKSKALPSSPRGGKNLPVF
jgi:hypothetical protein